MDGYEVIRLIATGGQGVVFQARQLSTKRVVALKVLHPLYGADVARKRFQREIELIAQLHHPNIVSVFESGLTEDGRPYAAMDYVRGAPLTEHVRSNGLGLRDTLRIFARVCDAVSHAHRRGIVHRDLKPSNILVDGEGEPKVLDFGLAKALGAPLETMLSISSNVMGTLAYMSPEQSRGRTEEVDARSDVYSLGVALYELLTGTFPYPVAGDMADTLRHISETPPTPLSRRWSPTAGVRGASGGGPRSGGCPIDRDVETITLKALSKDPARRYANAAEFGADVEAYLAQRPLSARRDSAIYLLGVQAQRFARRSPVVSSALSVLAVFLLADWFAPRVFSEWSSVTGMLQRYALDLGAASPERFEAVAILRLGPETDVPALAGAEGLEGVDPAGDPLSLRALHGRLMERLAGIGPRAVVWNIAFVENSRFDEAWVRGAQALAARGVPVVVAVHTWAVEPGGVPPLAEALRPHVRWGCAPSEFGPDAPWRLALMVQRGIGAGLPSLALSAVAAARRPEAQFEPRLGAASESVELVYWIPTDGGRTREWKPPHDQVLLSAVRAPMSAPQDFDIRRDDRIGHFVMVLPPDGVLHAAEVDYASVFDRTAHESHERLCGRIVLVSDARASALDRYQTPDGRTLMSAAGHATAIEMIERKQTLRLGSESVMALLTLGGTLIGLGLTRLTVRRNGLRFALLSLTTALGVGLSVAWLRTFGVYCESLVASTAMWMMSLVAAPMLRAQQENP